jgi:hypothetical protein
MESSNFFVGGLEIVLVGLTEIVEGFEFGFCFVPGGDDLFEEFYRQRGCHAPM